MFRYLALDWDARNPQHSALARRLLAAMQSAAHWQTALEAPGLNAFVKGRRSGINEAYRLGSDDGVILGTLFRRKAASVRVGAMLSPAEQEQILRTAGQALVDDYWGPYVAFMRLADGHCVVRDPLGGLPCFRLQHEGVCIVFSWLEDVLSLLPGIPVPAVAWDCLAAHIAFVFLAGRETVLEGVTQVLPGERASLPPASPSSTLLWSAASFAANPIDVEPGLAAAELRGKVAAAVQAWAGCYDRVLLRLSGGLDSTIVLACLDAAAVSAEVTCVNYHSPGSNSDERSYARLAALRARRPLIERERDPDYPLERVLDVACTPQPRGYLGRLDTTRMDAMLAKELGVDSMFTGAGGDQLFFQVRDWGAAADYLWIRGPDSGFPNAAMDAARLADLSVWRVMRLALRNRIGRPGPWPEAAVHLSLAVRDALPGAAQRARFAHPAEQAAESLPPAKRMHVQQLLIPTDNYDPYEKEAAPEIVSPLLSQPLLEHCLALPCYVLTSGGQPRALARRAFADAIPAQIATRHSKGGMEEHVTAILWRNLEFARALLLEGQLVARGLVDRGKIEAVLSGRPTTLTAHTTEVHIYLGIEAWLQRMTSQAPGPPPS